VIDDRPSASKEFYALLATKRTSGGVLFSDVSGRVLLVEPTYKQTWELPGGSVQANESPWEAAAREVAEELGLVLKPGRLLVVEHCAADNIRTDILCFVFDGGVLTDHDVETIALEHEELRSWRWCTAADTYELMSERVGRRTRFAIQARGTSTMLYVDDGVSR